MSLTLRNPHSVLAALQTRPQDVLEVRTSPGRPSDAWGEVIEKARAAGVPLRTELAPTGAQRLTAVKSERTGAASATVRERDSVLPAELWSGGDVQPGQLWLALDCLQDPHNVGAIIRTAAFFGVRGIIMTKDRSAPLSGTVYDVASGGMEAVPIATVANLATTMKDAQAAGLWVLGSSEHATKELAVISRDRPWLLVIGNEEQGLRRLTLERCDEQCRIAALGPIGSLNASVAAGILMAHLCGARS